MKYPYLKSSKVPTDGLVAWYDFTKADYLYDRSGNANNGVINGASWIAGRGENALSFNGSSDYVEVSDFAHSITTLSVFGWAKIPSQDSRALMGHSDFTDNQASWEMWLHPTRFQIQLSKDGTWTAGNQKQYFASITWDDTWHHIGFTWSSGTLKLYIDGAEQSVTKSKDDSYTTIHDSTANIFIGARPSGGVAGNFYSGIIDEILIYNRALQLDEVKALYEYRL